VAVVTTQEITLIPFPVRTQQRTLEPDGLAVAQGTILGDGSGGNSQITFRGPTSHLYVLRACSGQATGSATTPGNGEWTGRAFWIEDSSPGDGLFISIVGMAGSSAFSNKFATTSVSAKDLPESFSRIPLDAVISRPSSSNGFFIVDYDNITGQTIVIRVVFAAYRREALTVPGFLDGLRGVPLGPGVVR